MSDMQQVQSTGDWRQDIVMRALRGDDVKDRQFDGVVQDWLSGSKVRRADTKSEIIDRVGDRALATREKFKDVPDTDALKIKIMQGHSGVIDEVNAL